MKLKEEDEDTLSSYAKAIALPTGIKSGIDAKNKALKDAGVLDNERAEMKKDTPFIKKAAPKSEAWDDSLDKPYESTGRKAIDRISGLFKSGSKRVDQAMKAKYSKDVGEMPSGRYADSLEFLSHKKPLSKRSSKQ
jgi:hypothetical protein